MGRHCTGTQGELPKACSQHGGRFACPLCDVTSWPRRVLRASSSVCADVCIVGAGFAGLSTAYELLKQGTHKASANRSCTASHANSRTHTGRSVVVLDSGQVAGGQSSKSTAQAMTWNDKGFARLIDQFGRRRIRLLAKSHRDAIKYIQQASRF